MINIQDTVQYFGGIEGGTTGSRMVILNEKGQLIGQSEGPHTNHWHIGLQNAVYRLLTLVDKALENAQLPANTVLKVLGLSLSGVNTVENQGTLINLVRQQRPRVAERIQACNDALGTMATGTDKDAIVLIAGTGSICKLIHRSMSFIRIGGLGYLLGDEGSAFWIVHRAIMCCMKITEGFMQSPYNIDRIKHLIFDYFHIEEHRDLLPFFGEHVDKTLIAGLCKELAEAANEGDLFCKQLFYDAGVELGRHLSAAARYADKEGLMTEEGIEVVCCGSVFKSWNLIESGVRDALRPHNLNDCTHGRLKMYQLLKTAAFGAAIVAAKLECNIDLPRPAEALKLLCEIDLNPNNSNGHL